jgi:hypothetical protein
MSRIAAKRAPTGAHSETTEGTACGKRPRTAAVQGRAASGNALRLACDEASLAMGGPASGASGQAGAAPCAADVGDPYWFLDHGDTAAVQRRGAGGASSAGVHEAAEQGIRDAAGPLPFLDVIQPLFGRHELSRVQAHEGPSARAGAQAMGAEAFATGDHVAFGTTPSLHTAAHEAAHVVQQRRGVSLQRGVGAAGDVYEEHADRVADAVVAGRSAEALLDAHVGAGAAGAAVQRKPSDVPHFVSTVTAATPSEAGTLLMADPNVRELFAQVFPDGVIAQLPALVGLTGIAGLGEEALQETTVTVRWPCETGFCEIAVVHPLFHVLLNEIRWAKDSDAPEPSLFFHKWERNKDAGGGAGAGLTVFRSMHAAATALGMTGIIADAIGDPQNPLSKDNGYYTWARFGFNNTIQDDMKNFGKRLRVLRTRLAELPAARAQRDALAAALPEGCEAASAPSSGPRDTFS